MPLCIVRNDITKMQVDAIVNAANNTLLGGGGVDGAIHAAAGPRLLEECRLLGGCETGKSKITGAGNLPAKYVIHTVGPIWYGGQCGEAELLASCYRTSLNLAAEHGCESIAFPLISSGAYGYPKEEALRLAEREIRAFLDAHEMTVYLVIFDKEATRAGRKLFPEIAAYIDDRYAAQYDDRERRRRYGLYYTVNESGRTVRKRNSWYEEEPVESTLEETLKEEGETFSEMLLRKIDERGMTDSQCYKRANIDRKLFSKIRSDKTYQPSRGTVVAFAIALEMSITETEELMKKAGFAFSGASKFDIIVEYFIKHREYDVYRINEALFSFGQPTLG